MTNECKNWPFPKWKVVEKTKAYVPPKEKKCKPKQPPPTAPQAPV